MDKIAADQTKDVRDSIAQATRAAAAMEGIAESMAKNVDSVNKTVTINGDIAERQKLISELQSRAYLAIAFESMVLQNVAIGTKFEPKWNLVDRGNTPAANIRFAAFADVVPFPLEKGWKFPVPDEPQGYSSTISPGLHKII
jgi:hypothetical protein